MVDPLIALLLAFALGGAIALLYWPRRGLIPRWRQARRMTKHVLSEDALKHIYQWEMNGEQPTLQRIAGALDLKQNETARLIEHMTASGLLIHEAGELRLTAAGSEAALHIIRAHRLWERYLADETGFGEEAWHVQAEAFEHALSAEAVDALEAQLGYPTYDPHGDPIPTAEGGLTEQVGEPLTKLACPQWARIVHVEDEPDIVYAQLVAEGLHPGQTLRVVECSPERVRFWTNGDEHVLAPIVAANLTVVALSRDEQRPDHDGSLRLSEAELGQTVEVTGISHACRGAARRRFLDLGLVRGTRVMPEMRGAGGNPTAYRIRGALIALRDDQAQMIKVRRLNDDNHG